MSEPVRKTGIVVKFDPTEYAALQNIGNGNVSEGVRVCLRWAVHFQAIGLTAEDDLQYVGLCTVAD